MTSARILIVEDDRVVRRDLQQQLSRLGHRVVGASATGEEAITLAAAHAPDLVLMDIRLEGRVDGIEAARQIRDAHRIPIIYLTAYADDETVRRAAVTEPFGYLLKPFEEPQMRTVIQMALYKRDAEARLRLTERRYAATLAGIGDGVISCDGTGQVDYMNPVAERLTGWVAAAAAGRPIAEVMPVRDAETGATLAGLASLVLAGSAPPESRPRPAPAGPGPARGDVPPFPADPSPAYLPPAPGAGAQTGSGAAEGDRALERSVLLLPREGMPVAIEERGAPLLDDLGHPAGAVITFTDLTQRRQVANALRQAKADLAHISRVTLMGELAAAVAHEVNQPLMAIAANAGACLRWLSDDRPAIDKARVATERIVRDADRAGEVVRSIRALARRTRSRAGDVDLGALVRETLTLVRAELQRASVATDLAVAPGLPVLHGDRVQLQQVFLNLVVNAIEAMATVADRPRELRIELDARAGEAIIRVIDSGTGLPPDAVPQIFNAFFTTKPEGTGMGLSISRSIVELHGGRLSGSPRSPFGSIFEVALPIRPGGPAT
ncbi:response regulator (plasmid) [Paroceanicella profunda]|uniref:histidine kinase n=1 Tax=Paroceanicella profunda TaxID=2579971 RepID=A0A5B8FJW6_9RHOB|nr:response regulator [Paroceanicella profunda]QDL94947.1 response regulator [Paroceanicella profunda]